VSKSLKRTRLSKVAPVTALLLVVALNAPEEGVTSIDTERPAPPSPDEVLMLEELMEWVQGEYRVKDAAIAELTGAVREKQRSFELFHLYNDDQARDERLSELPYGGTIRRIAQRHSLDGLLVASVIEAESGFNPEALSPRGAEGLMQVMPSTPGYPQETGAYDPVVNIDLGTRYLRNLIRRFDGDLVLALAAYNAGPGAVERFQDVPPYRETKHYVARVLSLYVDHHQALWESTGASEYVFDVEELPTHQLALGAEVF
jgi:soluble lytic murein transglycosylase-like protein